MRIMVCGGAGYIGSMLCPELQRRGHEVEVVDLLWFGNQLPAGIKVRQQDCWSLREKDLDGIDVLIFLAGLSNDPMADFDPAANYIGNAALPGYLAYTARRASVGLMIHGGSCSVYGVATSDVDENADTNKAAYPYGVSKLMGEIGCLQQAQAELSVIAFRQGTVGGYSPRFRTDLVVNTMTMAALHHRRIMVRTPDAWRPLLDIEDAVGAYSRAIDQFVEWKAGHSSNYFLGVKNLVSENIRVLDIAQKIRRIIDPGIEVVVGDGTDLRNYRAVPSMDFGSYGGGVDNMVRSIVDHASEIGDYTEDRYNNIAVFKKLGILKAA